MTYEFHPAVEKEFLDAVGYYESRRAGLGTSFLTAFNSCIRQVCEAPDRYPVERQPDVRRARIARFPYALLYRSTEGRVQVLAVSHHRRRPNYWLGRL